MLHTLVKQLRKFIGSLVPGMCQCHSLVILALGSVVVRIWMYDQIIQR